MPYTYDQYGQPVQVPEGPAPIPPGGSAGDAALADFLRAALGGGGISSAANILANGLPQVQPGLPNLGGGTGLGAGQYSSPNPMDAGMIGPPASASPDAGLIGPPASAAPQPPPPVTTPNLVGPYAPPAPPAAPVPSDMTVGTAPMLSDLYNVAAGNAQIAPDIRQFVNAAANGSPDDVTNAAVNVANGGGVVQPAGAGAVAAGGQQTAAGAPSASASAPLPPPVAQAVASHGFKLPANTWDALIAFGAGLMKNSGQPHFAQAAGAALESATAQMTDAQKTTFNQQLEIRKLISQVDLHRDQLNATIANQRLSHEDRQAAIAERAQASQDRNALMAMLGAGNQDLKATMAGISQQRADTAAEAERNRTAAAATAAQTRTDQLARQTQSDADKYEESYRKSLDASMAGTTMTEQQKDLATLAKTAARHPNSTQAQAWADRRSEVIDQAKAAIAQGAKPADVIKRLSPFGLGARDLQ